MPVPFESSRQFGDRGMLPSQDGHVTVRAKRYAHTCLFAGRQVRIVGGSGFSLGLRFLGVKPGCQVTYSVQEAAPDLLEVVHQFPTVLLGPLAGCPKDESSHWVQFVGDGSESQAPCFEGYRPAACGDVQHHWVQYPSLLIETSGLCEEGPLVWEGNVGPYAPWLSSRPSVVGLVTTSGEVPMLLMNSARFASSGSIDAATTARDTIRGRLAHQT